MKRVELIVNPLAGRGRARAAAEIAGRVLEAAGWEVVIRLPLSPGAAHAAAGAASLECDAVIAVGGDGTIRTVLEGLRRAIPVGVIPLGTANVVARELRIPLDPAGAAAVVARGGVRFLDLGEADGRRFLAMAGVGLDAEIVAAIHAHREGPIRKLDFVRPTWDAWRGSALGRLRLTSDGSEWTSALQDVIVCNTRNFGAYFAVTPNARPDDGRLDWVGRGPSGSASAIAWAIAALCGRPAPFLHYGQAETLRIEATGDPVPVQLDGDPAGTTPVSLRILPSAARVFAP